jgi:transcriptional regulator EpsA
LNAANSLDPEDRDRLLLVVESALHVRNDSGFFLWSQGALQCLVPHEIMICGVGAGPSFGPRFHWYSSTRYFTEEHFRSVCEPCGGLVSSLMHEWFEHGRARFLVEPGLDEETRLQLRELELKNLVGHGVSGGESGCGGYYCFSRTSLEETPRSAHILDLVLPHVHATFCRVLAARTARPAGVHDAIVTPREAQILHLIKDGNTTSTIAETLSLSPFTVRNHVKKIFRKLGARSRSHAVAQALSQGLLTRRDD